MKKSLNGKKKKNKNLVIKIFVISIFLFFICSSLILSKRKFLYVESGFKSFSSIISTYITKNMYTSRKKSDTYYKTKYDYLKKENDELRKTIDIKLKNENYVVAKISNQILKDATGRITIDKGIKDNIKKKMPVVTENGLIGFISKSSSLISEVNLITNVSDSNMISILIESSDGLISGILSNYDSKNNLFKITDIMQKSNIEKGNRVVLSGYDNDSYKGIYLGKVVKQESDNYGLTKTVWLKSDNNFDDLLYVLVVGDK